jgi:hypothetical protein
MNINEYLAANNGRYPRSNHTRNRKAIVCADGLILSVQASDTHYCSPRENDGPYSHVEVGYPSEVVPELLEYAETPETPTSTVYGYVPAELVDAVIEAHGGIVDSRGMSYAAMFAK